MSGECVGMRGNAWGAWEYVGVLWEYVGVLWEYVGEYLVLFSTSKNALFSLVGFFTYIYKVYTYNNT
jgi:hypothetical protein